MPKRDGTTQLMEHLERKTLDTILDGLSELVYVCDPVTYDLLYLNKEGRLLYGEEAADGTHKCYETLQGQPAPCSFCTTERLSSETFYEWEFTNPTRNRHYLLRDKLVKWEGRWARFEIAFDVTDRELEKESFKFLAGANALNVECIRALENERIGTALDRVLKMLGEFLLADRTYIFKIADDRMSNIFEWCAEGVAPEMQNLADMPVSLIDQWLEAFSNGEAVIINDVDELASLGREDERDVLSAQGIRSLVAVPLEVDGRFVGYLGADDPKKSRLEIIEQPLVSLASFVSASMKRALSQRQVEELTWNDRLTGAHARGTFHRDFDRGPFEDVGILLVDADRLTDINHDQGRDKGDEVLRRMAASLTDLFGDCVYRIGDDEFVVVATPIVREEFDRLANDAILRFIEEGLPASAGSAWSGHCDAITDLLDPADDRMRQAKRGRHRAVDMGVDLAQDAAVGSLARPGGAEAAVEAGLLDIYLMPQASTSTGELVGAEALIRYIDAERGIEVQPASFIPMLEDMGEIAQVDFFALSRACETVARWRREGAPVVPIAVNFSRLTVGESRFAHRVRETVERHGVEPSLIEIEVTESACGRDGDLLREVADDLRADGFRVAIDDFGVEDANVSLFVQLDFDVLKLDRTLIRHLDEAERTVHIVQSLSNLCGDLGIESVAEGIETQEQLDALRTTSCTRAQGYLIGRPVPVATFERDHLARLRRCGRGI